MAGRWAVRRASGLWGLAVVAALLTGCGTPEFTYVTNSADHTYVKIPRSWQQIDQRSLADAVGLDPAFSSADQGIWLAGYDASSPPSLTHLFGAQADVPVVLVEVKNNSATTRGQYSLDALRDQFLPVSATGRQTAATDGTSTLSDFQLFVDQVLTPGQGVHGVHEVYRYRFAGGTPQMFDLTAYVNDDASKLYMFIVRCSTECYMQRQQEITTVVSSFTVRETP